MRHQLLFRLMIGTPCEIFGCFDLSRRHPGRRHRCGVTTHGHLFDALGGATSQELSHCTGSGAVAHEAGASADPLTFVMSTWAITWADGRAEQFYPPITNCTRVRQIPALLKPGYSKERMVTEAGYVRSLGTTTIGMI